MPATTAKKAELPKVKTAPVKREARSAKLARFDTLAPKIRKHLEAEQMTGHGDAVAVALGLTPKDFGDFRLYAKTDDFQTKHHWRFVPLKSLRSPVWAVEPVGRTK